MTKPAYILFQPANDDPNDQSMLIGAQYVKHAFFANNSQGRENSLTHFTHIDSMGALSSYDPAVLIVFGHGNMGAGIGTHKTHYDETALVRLLSSNGLKTKQKNLTIYLWACNTGAKTPGSGTFSRTREPFAKRFANKLHAAGFSGIRVIGVAGFIAGSGSFTSLTYTDRPVIETPKVQPTDASRHIYFDVGATGVVAGNNTTWKCSAMPGNKGWKTSKV